MLDAVRADVARAAGLVKRRCCACACGSSVGALLPAPAADAARGPCDPCDPESVPGELGCCCRRASNALGMVVLVE